MEVYFQQNNELQKNDGSQWRRLTATPRLDDDNAPDGDASEQRKVILAEVDSAKKTCCVCGFKVAVTNGKRGKYKRQAPFSRCVRACSVLSWRWECSQHHRWNCPILLECSNSDLLSPKDQLTFMSNINSLLCTMYIMVSFDTSSWPINTLLSSYKC